MTCPGWIVLAQSSCDSSRAGTRLPHRSARGIQAGGRKVPSESTAARAELTTRQTRSRGGGTFIGVTRPTADALLVAGATQTMAQAWRKYPYLHDQVLEEVHARLNSAGYATKFDLAALIALKHVQTAPWMQDLLKFPPLGVQQRTPRYPSRLTPGTHRLGGLRWHDGPAPKGKVTAPTSRQRGALRRTRAFGT
jgi:hypothetical protein